MINRKKIGILILAIGLILLIFPMVTQQLIVLDTGDELTVDWTASGGVLSRDSFTKFEGEASIAWTTDLASNQWDSYCMYRTENAPWWDWTPTPVFSAKVYPRDVSGTFNVELITAEGTWTEYYYTAVVLVVNQWNDVIVDFRYPSSGDGPDLAMVRGVRLHWNWGAVGGLGTDFTTNVDLLELSPATGNAVLQVLQPTHGVLDPQPGYHAYVAETVVTITATAGTGYELDHFEVDYFDVGNGTKQDNTWIYTLTMDTDHTIAAVFSQVSIPVGQAIVTVSQTTGGSFVITDYAGTVLATTSGTYELAEGTILTLTATPDTGYEFVHWRFTSPTAQNYIANPHTITLQAGTTYEFEATFAEPVIIEPDVLSHIQWTGILMSICGAVLVVLPTKKP